MPLRSDSENFALIRVIGVGGGGSKRRQPDDPRRDDGRRVHRLQHRRPGAAPVGRAAQDPDRRQDHEGSRGRRRFLCWPARRGRGFREDRPGAGRLRHGVHHGRARWRYRVRRCPGGGPAREAARCAHDRRRDQAVQLRGQQAQARCGARGRGAEGPGRHPDHGPERSAQGRRPEGNLDPRRLPRRRRRPAAGRPGDQRHHHDARTHQPRLRRRPRDHEGRGLGAHGDRPRDRREPRRGGCPPGDREPAARGRHRRRPGHPLQHHAARRTSLSTR